MTVYKVVGIGNAIVDVITQSDDSFLELIGVQKGIMQLVERDRGQVLYGVMQDRTQAPGGSVANTIAGLGKLGLSTGFIGRVSADALGHFYADAMAKNGTDFVNPPVVGGELPTSRSMIFVSPDGERSMNTYLGISADLDARDVPQSTVEQAEILFLEGYLFDKSGGKKAFKHATRACQKAGGKVGISLSDPFCVDRHREDFRTLVRQLDYAIGNHEEWQSLYQAQDLDSALQQASQECDLIVCTRGAAGATLANKHEKIDIPVTPITTLDSTGAGDQFATGFIFGLATGRDLETCGRMGCIAATEVIGHIGPRPEADIAQLFASAGL
ncbi:MAG: adenosine kinase [Paracoccaceae bacterium]|nr:adenosine kinase [Paracoccaceae bacterium]